MTKKLFGTDGIRGVAGRWPLTEDFVRRIGYFSGRVIAGETPRSKSVLVVRDTRRSGLVLQRALSRGLAAAGFRVHDGGVLPTPSVALLLPHRGFAAGAVVSASHNPARFNGIKFFSRTGEKLPDSLERHIEQMILSTDPVPSAKTAARNVRDWQATREYEVFLRSTLGKGAKLDGLKIAIDCANGATSSMAGRLFRSLGAETTVMSARPDGLNINRSCGALHPEGLARYVRSHRMDIGMAFDGDGDRAIFVDEHGVVRDGETVILAAARHLKLTHRLKNNRVVITVMTNLGLRQALKALDIEMIETPVGDRYVWQAMQKVGAVLGGEPSGHVIFREFLPTGDGMLTAIQLLSILRTSGQSLSTLAALAIRYPQVLLNVPVREKKPLEDLDGFQNAVKRVEKELGQAGRVLIRYSGTEPLLRIMIEGPNDNVINRYARSLRDQVRREGL